MRAQLDKLSATALQGIIVGGLIAALAVATLTSSAPRPAWAAELPITETLERNELERTLRVTQKRTAYDRLYKRAKKLDAAPKRPATDRDLGPAKLERALKRLRADVRKARKAQRPSFEPPQSVGVSNGTLETIAACESGGNPAAVSASGTYRGKYQFDHQTWASVGGSGDPAAAPEAEQDYRAALLYSRAGSSPWPTCGV